MVRGIDDVAPAEGGGGGLKAEDVLGIPLTIKGYDELDGKFGTFFLIQAVADDGAPVEFSCGGQVVIDQLKKCAANEQFPVAAQVSKKFNPASGRNYYILENPGAVADEEPVKEEPAMVSETPTVRERVAEADVGPMSGVARLLQLKPLITRAGLSPGDVENLVKAVSEGRTLTMLDLTDEEYGRLVEALS